MNKDIQSQAFTFKNRYNYDYSKHYYQRHKQGGFKYISNVLEQHMADKALSLAGNPQTVLDLPCGAGRFWETLLKHGVQKIIGMDQSEGMLQVCQETAPAEQLKHIELLQGDASNIPLPDNAVDSVFCMRLLHHIDIKNLRMEFYKEFQRVSAGTVCISYWVDGNLKSGINLRRPHKNQNYMNQVLLENEFKEADFEIIGHVDMLKFYSPWRTYVLRAK
jgi:ubiquinone/menaquinone biosynthesis C-methylase UbiE